MSKLLPFSPLEPDQVWEYGPTYHRQDRFTVLRRGFAGLWITKEVDSGDERHYIEVDVHRIAVPTLVQTGQTWDPLTNTSGGPIKIKRCESPLTRGVWRWGCEDVRTGGYLNLNEMVVTLGYALVDGLGGPPRQSNGPCNRCGMPALTLGLTVECGNKKCPNFKP